MVDSDLPLDDDRPGADAPDDDLTRRLDILLDEAQASLQVPLRARNEFHRGFIETVAVDPSGLCWVSGWLHRDQPEAFPAVILDRQKFPAAVALTSYPREDLPGHAHAVIGAIRTTWKPSSPDADIFMFFGEDMQFHQRTVRPLRMMEPGAALEQFAAVRAQCLGSLTQPLQRLVASPDNWMPDSAKAAGFPAHAAVDRLMMLPGFGCLAEGWAMSPVKRVRRFALKSGGRVMHGDPLATYFRPRHDLREAFPECGGSITDRAGFVTVFRGRIEPADFIDPILKVVYHDGTSANHPVQARAMRQIAHSALPEDALTLFPALPQEGFFPDFARALRRDAGRRRGGVRGWQVAPCPDRAVVAVLPRDRSDAYLLFEELGDRLGRLADPPGVILLAERDGTRREVLALFDGLAGALGAAVPRSLFFVDDADHGFHLAAEALRATGARRFLFLGRGAVLSEAGWRQGLALLDEAAAGMAPQVLGLEPGDPAAPDALVWTTAGLAAALPALPVFLGGRHGDNGLGAAGIAAVVHPGMGLRSDGGRGVSALTEAINAVGPAAARGPATARGEAA